MEKAKEGGRRKDLTSGSKFPRRSFGKGEKTVTLAGQSQPLRLHSPIQQGCGSASPTSTEMVLQSLVTFQLSNVIAF